MSNYCKECFKKQEEIEKLKKTIKKYRNTLEEIRDFRENECLNNCEYLLNPRYSCEDCPFLELKTKIEEVLDEQN